MSTENLNQKINIAFVGNPNVGKSALINELAGSKLKIGNWAGVTVEKKTATLTHKNKILDFVDLPGTYSLSGHNIEETITTEYIIRDKPDLIINVVDSTNVERNLYLTMLLKELGRPVLLVLNFIDEFELLKYKVDIQKLEAYLGIKVIKTSAKKCIGITEVLDTCANYELLPAYTNRIKFDNNLEDAIGKTIEIIKNDNRLDYILNYCPEHFLAIKFLEKDKYFESVIRNDLSLNINEIAAQERNKIEASYEDDIATLFAEARYKNIKNIASKCLILTNKTRLDITSKIDSLLINKYLGLPIFFMAMYVLMNIVFNGANPFIDWMDGFIGYIIKYTHVAISGIPAWLESLVLDGIVGGVGGVIVFIPLMIFLYLFLSILEESGYMSRVAFVMDRIMTSVGLNGKSFLPLILGFGCTVPAIYATRTIEDEKARKLTALMTPFISCGARLPVYGLFTAAFFPDNGGLIVASLYFLGMFISIAVAFLFKKHPLFQADNSSTLIELPPYRLPSIKIIWKSTVSRTKTYLKRAMTIIVGILILLWALTYFPNPDNASDSYMASIGKFTAPVMAPTGFGDKWEAVSAIPPSIAAKEVVVGYLAQILPIDENETDETPAFMEDTLEQFNALLSAFKNSFLGIISFNIAGLFTPPDAEEIEEEGTGIIYAISNLWEDTALGDIKSYSFMIFILLLVPCIVTLAAIRQEFGGKFMWLVVGVCLLVPYTASTVFYQIARLLI